MQLTEVEIFAMLGRLYAENIKLQELFQGLQEAALVGGKDADPDTPRVDGGQG